MYIFCLTNRLTCLKSEKYSSSLRKSTSPSSTRQSFYLKLKHSSAVAYTKNDSSSILAFWYIIKTKIKGIKPGVDQEWTNSLTILTMNLKGCAGPDSKPFLQPQSTWSPARLKNRAPHNLVLRPLLFIVCIQLLISSTIRLWGSSVDHMYADDNQLIASVLAFQLQQVCTTTSSTADSEKA